MAGKVFGVSALRPARPSSRYATTGAGTCARSESVEDRECIDKRGGIAGRGTAGNDVQRVANDVRDDQAEQVPTRKA